MSMSVYMMSWCGRIKKITTIECVLNGNSVFQKKKTNMFESWMNNGNMDLIFLSK